MKKPEMRFNALTPRRFDPELVTANNPSELRPEFRMPIELQRLRGYMISLENMRRTNIQLLHAKRRRLEAQWKKEDEQWAALRGSQEDGSLA